MKNIKTDSFWFYAFFCILLILIGGVLNFTVMNSNNCKMPIKDSGGYPLYNSECYVSFTSFQEVNLGILSDIIDIRTKNYIHHLSIGDFIASLGGLGMTILCVGKGINIWKRKRKVFK